jgi:L-fuculose-phosphate aldolase
MLLYEEREQVRQSCLKMLDMQLTTGTSGNISVFNREKGLYAMSPSSMDYHEIKTEDVVVMDLEGNIVDGKRRPSIEHVMHRLYYTDREGMNAVVHTHSVFAASVAALNIPLPAVSFLVALSGAFEVPVAPFAPPGSEELAKIAFDTMGDANAVLLQNHGLICCAPDIGAAMNIADELEFVAKVYIHSKSAGEPVILKPEQMQVIG